MCHTSRQTAQISGYGLSYTRHPLPHTSRKSRSELGCMILLNSAVVKLLVTREILFCSTENHTQIHPVRVVLCGNPLEANFVICGIENTYIFSFKVFNELSLFEMLSCYVILN
jgi:hypothetical protein